MSNPAIVLGSHSRGLRRWGTNLCALYVILLAATTAGAFEAITVPYRPHDPGVPHPAYNGHPTRFKAIARDLPAGCGNPYFRWDIDGDGEWDSCEGRNYVNAAGRWYRDERYGLDCLQHLPEVEPEEARRRLFVATIEVSCSVDAAGNSQDSAFAAYPLMVFAEVPRGRDPRADFNTYAYTARPRVDAARCNGGTCAETGFPCSSDAECEGDDDEALQIKRAVSIDDGLWFLHKHMNGYRTGEGVATILGRMYGGRAPGSGGTYHRRGIFYDYTGTAVYLWSLSQNGHIPAYPPGTYVHGDAADVRPLPENWPEENDFRYENDPYAETAARLLNFLVSNFSATYAWEHWAVNENGIEGNDGRPRLDGVNGDGRSYYLAGQYTIGPVLGAIASSGMGGTTCQTGVCLSHSIEWFVQQIVDAVCLVQGRGAWNGGWGYRGRSADVGSLAQWAMIGMEAADFAMSKHGVVVNNYCKHRVPDFLIRNQAPDTGSGRYQYSGSYPGRTCPHLTGGILVGHGWIDSNLLPDNDVCSFAPYSNHSNATLRNGYFAALRYIGTSWHWFGCGINCSYEGGNWTNPNTRFNGSQQGSIYTHYSIQKGLRTMSPQVDLIPLDDNGDGIIDERDNDPSNDIDWFREYSYYYVNNQEVNGGTRQRRSDRWGAGRIVGPAVRTAWGGVLVLTPTLFDPLPVAVGTASPMQVLEGCVGADFGRVTFNHQGSYHLSPSRQIIDYQWLFEVANPDDPGFDAVDWGSIPDGAYSADGRAWHSSQANATPVHSYQSHGTFTAALRVVDDNDEPKDDILVIAGIEVTRQDPMPPTANPAGPYFISAGEPLQLEGAVDDLNLLCYPDEVLSSGWDIDGDGQFDDLGQAAGEVSWDTLDGLDLPRNQPFDITLRVSDSTGNVVTATAQLTIYDSDPNPCFAVMPPVAGCGEVVEVDASCTTHPDPRRVIRLYEWQWVSPQEFGEGDDPQDFPFHADAVGVNQSHVYPRIGTHRITLRVTDNAETRAIVQHEVTVEARSGPEARPGGPYTVETWLGQDGQRVGAPLALDGSESTDPDIGCGDSIESYSWDLNGDRVFGDADGERPVLSWAELEALLAAAGMGPGDYLANPDSGLPRVPVSLRVQDSTNRTHEALTHLLIYHNGPYAEFVVAPTQASCHQQVSFDASRSSHGHPDHGILLYEWDFDVAAVVDGDAAQIMGQFRVEAQGRQVTEAYDQFGTYHPVLRVTDDQGRMDFYWGERVEVNVGNSAPEVHAGGPYVHHIDGILNLDASDTEDPDEECGDSVQSYSWDVDGDGQFGDAEGEQPRIVWADLALLLDRPGQYPTDPRTGEPRIQIAVQATDSFGAVGVGTATLVIYDRSPFAVADWGPRPFVPIDAEQHAMVQFDGSGSYHGHPANHVVGWSWRQRGAAQSVRGEHAELDVDLNGLGEIPDEGVSLTFELTVTDDRATTDRVEFEVLFNHAPSTPPDIVFDLPAIYIVRGEGFELSAADTSDPDGDWLQEVAWDLTGDGADDIVVLRQDTDGDGDVDRDDARPSLDLELSWAQMGDHAGLRDLGEHEIRLRVTDSTGTSAEDSITLHILEHALVAEARVRPDAGGCQTWFSFDGSESRHLFPGEDVVAWLWDFDGDGEFDESGEEVSHVFGAFDVYTVTLRVGDLMGHWAFDTVDVSTQGGNRPPVADAGGPYFADSELQDGLTLDASGSEELDVACGDRILAYRWDLDGVLDGNGDRSWEVVTEDAQVHVAWASLAGLPRDDADHAIVLEVEDSLGGVGEARTTLLIADGTPVASFQLAPEVAGCGQPVSFDASASYHPVPGEEIDSYEWDFNYDARVGFVASGLHVNDVEFQHVFDTMGDLLVALRVSDDAGRHSVATREVSVSGDNLPPVARTNGPVNGIWNEPLVLDASPSRDPNEGCGDAIVSYEWDLDDNGAYEVSSDDEVVTLPWNQVLGYGFERADPFTHEPSYPISLRVTDMLGQQGTLAAALRIYEAVPVARAAVRPAVAGCGVEMTFDGSGSFHSHPDRRIVSYVWDFDVEVDSDDNGTPDDDQDAVGAVVGHSYERMNYENGQAVPHVASLTVTDDRNPPQTSSTTVDATLSFQNFRPIADAGGPYLTTVFNDTDPAPVNLDGSGSRDPNEPCDEIVRYMWDTDNDGLFGEEDDDGALCGARDCEGPTARVVSDDWRIGRSFKVSLVVEDAYGQRSEVSETTITVQSSVPPTIVLIEPNGGEVLGGMGELRLRLSHPDPQPQQVDLEFYLNEVAINLPAGQSASVMTEAGGELRTVERSFDTTTFADGRDVYRLRVVARLHDEPDLFSEVFSQSPFSIDNTPPLLSLPGGAPDPMQQEDQDGTAFSFEPEYSDNLDDQPRLEVQPDLQTYPLGTTTVTFTATDWAGNSTVLQADVEVVDTDAPTLLVDPDITREAESPDGTQVAFSPSAWDICDAEISEQNNKLTNDAPPDGFPVGDTTVTFTATDASGNSTEATVEVSITDTTPPRIVLPNPPRRNVEMVGPLGIPADEVALPMPTLSDNGTAADDLTCVVMLALDDEDGQSHDLSLACGAALPGDRFFPPNETRVRYVATDEAGNSAEAFYTIMVLDGRAPAVEVLEQPPTDRWLTGAATLRFTVTDASDPDPAVNVAPLPAGMEELLPGPNGVYELVYTEDGSYDLRILASDNEGNESVVILDRFGIDRAPPELTIRNFPVHGVDPEDDSSFPVFFVGEEIAPRLSASDQLAGLRSIELILSPGNQQGQEVSLVDQDLQVAGRPPTGPHFSGNLSCEDRDGVCDDGRIDLRNMARGIQRLLFTVEDAVGNEAVLQAPFRIMDLGEAIILVREHLVAYLAQEELADDLRVALEELDLLLATGQTSLGHGFLGGCLVSMEDATKAMTLDPVLVNALRDELDADARLLARGAYSDAYLYWEDAAVGTAEEGSGLDFLRNAHDFIWELGFYSAAVLATENAYFYSRNGAIPFRATDVLSSIEVMREILDEMDAYLQFADLPGLDEVYDARWLLHDDVQWKFQELQHSGYLGPRHFMDMLLDLQELALSLVAAEDQGVWVRNWQWGLGQMIRVVVDLAKAEAEFELGEDHCKIEEAEAAYEQGMTWLDNRNVDLMLGLFASDEIRCLMLEIYHLAGWEPLFPPEEHDCALLGCRD